jgi:hypothetical protein
MDFLKGIDTSPGEGKNLIVRGGYIVGGKEGSG